MSLSYLYTNTKNLLTVIFPTWLTKCELKMVWTHFFFFFLMYFSWANSVLSLNVVLLSMSCWTISFNTHEWTCELNVFGTTYEHLNTFMNNSTNSLACCRVLLLLILYYVFPFNTINIYFIGTSCFPPVFLLREAHSEKTQYLTSDQLNGKNIEEVALDQFWDQTIQNRV